MNVAGLIFDNSYHYLDHLAPLCSLQNWPLIVCEPQVAELARQYYLSLEVIEMDRWDLKLPPFVVSCDSRKFIESALSPNSEVQFFWLPHGNSDKGWKGPFFNPLEGENVFVYGQKMIDLLQEKSIRPKTVIRIGNFRLFYWMKHQAFYENKLKKIFKKSNNKTYLYAPTWDDSEENSSFWTLFASLASHLPKDCNLIVKIHPNTRHQFAPEIERLIGKYGKWSNLFFVPEFPPVYPLLNLCDAYIGDMSSIGYDFLYWNRPMYFLKNSAQSHFLYRAGMEITQNEIASIFENNSMNKQEIQSKIYLYTFDSYTQMKEVL